MTGSSAGNSAAISLEPLRLSNHTYFGETQGEHTVGSGV